MQTVTQHKYAQNYLSTLVRREVRPSLPTREQQSWYDVYDFSGIINDSMRKYNHQSRRCIESEE